MRILRNISIMVLIAAVILGHYSFSSGTSTSKTALQANSRTNKYFQKHQCKQKSVSSGSVSKGSLKNGHLWPFEGPNYCYFSEVSYLSGRAFVNSEVLKSALASYEFLESANADRSYVVMECSHKKGGKLWPHRTHQNGLSVDFMSPLKKNGKPYHKLDDMGATHYMMEFDKNGVYLKDPSVSIDFEAIAQHILSIQSKGKKYGVKIKKIIINTDLKDDLYKGKFGQQLKNSGIYVVKSLSPKINALHDDHYHIDFSVE